MSTGMVQTRDMALVGVILGLFGLGLGMFCAVFYWPLFL
jgi:di/tricarboxylate transporter